MSQFLSHRNTCNEAVVVILNKKLDFIFAPDLLLIKSPELGTRRNVNFDQNSKTQIGCSILLFSKQGTSKDHASSRCCNTPSTPSA